MKQVIYDWGGANVWLFHLINNIHGHLLDKFMLFGTQLGSRKNFAVYMGLVTLFALFSVSRAEDKPRQALRWFVVISGFNVAYLLDAMFVDGFKPVLDLPRPSLALLPGTVLVVGEPEYHHSFPSGHASFAMLVAASLWPIFNRYWRACGCFFVIWVCLSRVSVGAHFPADVLGGALSSFLIVWLVRTSFIPLFLPEEKMKERL